MIGLRRWSGLRTIIKITESCIVTVAGTFDHLMRGLTIKCSAK
jgi:hypothetical protein